MRRCAPAVRVVRKPSKGAERRRFSSVFARTSSTYLPTHAPVLLVRVVSVLFLLCFIFCCLSHCFFCLEQHRLVRTQPLQTAAYQPFLGGLGANGSIHVRPEQRTYGTVYLGVLYSIWKPTGRRISHSRGRRWRHGVAFRQQQRLVCSSSSSAVAGCMWGCRSGDLCHSGPKCMDLLVLPFISQRSSNFRRERCVSYAALPAVVGQ